MSIPQDIYEKYLEQLIKGGYLSPRNLAPLKCVHCDSKNLVDTDSCFEDTVMVEYTLKCKECGKVAGYWSYGTWEI
mgnify:CR=1 FL=1